MNKCELRSLLADPDPATPAGRIVKVLSERGGLSGTQIAGLTGLAKSTVSTALAELRKSGLVVDLDVENARGASVGRPRTLVTLNPEAGTCVGVVIGLRNIQVVVADVSHAIISDSSAAMQPDFSPQQAIEVVKGLMDRAYEQHSLPRSGLLGVGLAIAGPVNPNDSRIQRASVVPTWAGMDIRAVFAPALAKPIYADNESNCAALAEMMWGAAVGHDDFVLFKVDEGVGGAIVVGGRVVTGIAGSAGEFGHMTIDPDGPLCRCGNRGCLELYASFKRNLVLASERFGRELSMDDVIRMAEEGDVGCRRLIEDTAHFAGRGLGMIGTIINPPLVIVAGRMALAGDMLIEPLKSSYERHTLVKHGDVGPEARTQIVKGRFTTNDSSLGAVGLVLRHHGRLN